MKITREEALAIMRYSIKNPDYKFPLELMNFEYGKDSWCDEEWCEEECKCFTGIDLVDDWDRKDLGFFGGFRFRVSRVSSFQTKRYR